MKTAKSYFPTNLFPLKANTVWKMSDWLIELQKLTQNLQSRFGIGAITRTWSRRFPVELLLQLQEVLFHRSSPSMSQELLSWCLWVKLSFLRSRAETMSGMWEILWVMITEVYRHRNCRVQWSCKETWCGRRFFLTSYIVTSLISHFLWISSMYTIITLWWGPVWRGYRPYTPMGRPF